MEENFSEDLDYCAVSMGERKVAQTPKESVGGARRESRLRGPMSC